MSNSISNYSYNGISGLASGLDTEEVVKKLISASQAKVDKANQQKTILEWKQSYYKEIVAKINNLKNKYFGSSTNSITINDKLKNLKALNFNSPYVSINPGLSASKGNIYIDDIISLATASSVESSNTVSTSPIMEIDESKLSDLSGKSFKFNLDGDIKTIKFSKENYASVEDVRSDLQAMLDKTYGSGKINATLSDGKISINAQSGSSISLLNSGIENGEASEILGFTPGASNRLNLSAALADNPSSSKIFTGSENSISFSINGENFTYSSDKAINHIIDDINKSKAGVTISYSSLSDKFTMLSTQTGVSSNISFEDTDGSFLSEMFGAGNAKAGTDAVVNVSTNGMAGDENLITITRSSNTFDINGTSVTLLGKAAGDVKESISAKIDIDTEAVFSAVSDFFNDYNDLIGSLTSKLSEKKYTDYPPLTADQESAMSETEVKNWNEKAKSGLFQNDMYLSSISNELRSCFFTNVHEIGSDDKTIGNLISDLGLATSVYSDRGKITVDADKLKAAIIADPDKVIKLFTQQPNSTYSQYATSEQKQQRYKESGLFWRFNDIIQKNMSTIGIKGALIELVGGPNDKYDSQTAYGKRISEMEKKIETLKARLSAEESRYWKKFSAMESSLSILYSQSSWLSQQFSTSTN